MKKWLTLMLALMMMLSAAALADAPTELLDAFTGEEALAAEAVRTAVPGAVVNYAVKERDDGRWEWDVFFSQEGVLGVCTLNAETYEVRKTRTYDNLPEGALTADQAVAVLKEAKGELIVIDLELDRDDGRIRYEGEVEQNGARYDFEMNLNGKLVEWERD